MKSVVCVLRRVKKGLATVSRGLPPLASRSVSCLAVCFEWQGWQALFSNYARTRKVEREKKQCIVTAQSENCPLPPLPRAQNPQTATGIFGKPLPPVAIATLAKYQRGDVR